jgi:putative endonuclease
MYPTRLSHACLQDPAMKHPAVYMLASQRNGTLYIGVTSNLIQRVWQHKEGLVEGFTQKYGVKILVWYEQHETMESAISREKAMKKWLRDWKVKTIEQANPDWRDLWPEITGESPQAGLSTEVESSPTYVIPAHAGIQPNKHPAIQPNAFAQANPVDSRMRGNDEGVI